MYFIYSPTQKLIAPQLAEYDIALSLSENSAVVSTGSISVVTVGDVVYNELTNSIVRYTNDIIVSGNPIGDVVTYNNLNPELITLDENGKSTYVATGTASVNVNSKLKKRTRRINVPSYQTPVSNNKVFNSFVTSSLSYNISSSILSMIDGLTASTASYNILSSVDDVNKVYVRNENLFCKDIDLTCVPVLRDNQQTGKGCLVSKDILLTAAHVGGGSSYIFVDRYNNIVTASVLSTTSILNTDIQVVRFSQDVTGSITPCKVFSATQISGSPISNAANRSGNLLAIYTNQFREYHIENIVLDYISHYDYGTCNPVLASWCRGIVVGDSGNPYFMFADGEPFLCGTWTTPNGGSSLPIFFDSINTTITNLGSTNLLTTSSFDDYSY